MGAGCTGTIVFGYMTYRYIHAHLTYKRNYISKRDEGRVVDFKTDKTIPQHKPVVEY
jgi:hypothetical protein